MRPAIHEDLLMASSALNRVRAMCLALPEATERPSHGAPTWFVGKRPSFVSYLDDHHGDGRCGLWCAAPVGAQDAWVGSDSEQFYVPAYVGHRGWVGVRLDRGPDWDVVAEIVEDAYRTVASVRLRRLLDDQQQPAAQA